MDWNQGIPAMSSPESGTCKHVVTPLLVYLRAQQVIFPVRKWIRHSRVSLVKLKSSVEARCL